jgi:GntR family transcriptional regulator, transcriptional repressor for pyruvate dehydrogenase complex
MTAAVPGDPNARAAATLLRTARPSAGPQTRSASIAHDIEELILRGDLPRGQRLPTESELGEVLGVSRSVVRDAVRMLMARGLLEVRQGHGTVVAPPSDEVFGNALVGLLMRSGVTMGDVIEARAALETQLAPLMAQNATDEDLRRMEDRLVDIGAAVDADDDEAIDVAHLDFHRAMYDALHRPALEALLRPMQRCILLTSPLMKPEDRKNWLDAHREILVAMRKRDPVQAEAAVRAHFADLSEPRYDDWRTRPFREVAVLDADRLRAAAVRESIA